MYRLCQGLETLLHLCELLFLSTQWPWDVGKTEEEMETQVLAHARRSQDGAPSKYDAESHALFAPAWGADLEGCVKMAGDDGMLGELGDPPD